MTLSLIARGETPLRQDHVLQQLVAVLKREPGTVLDDLIARQLVTAPASDPSRVTLTAHGDAQVCRVRQHIAQAIERVYGDLPPADVATTHRVLGMIAERASRELER